MNNYIQVGNTELIARQGYAGLGLSWGDVTGAAKGALNFYGKAQQAEGRAAAATEIAKAQAAAAAARTRQAGGGFKKYLPFVAIGGVALVGVLLLRGKK